MEGLSNKNRLRRWAHCLLREETKELEEMEMEGTEEYKQRKQWLGELDSASFPEIFIILSKLSALWE